MAGLLGTGVDCCAALGMIVLGVRVERSIQFSVG